MSVVWEGDNFLSPSNFTQSEDHTILLEASQLEFLFPFSIVNLFTNQTREASIQLSSSD